MSSFMYNVGNLHNIESALVALIPGLTWNIIIHLKINNLNQIPLSKDAIQIIIIILLMVCLNNPKYFLIYTKYTLISGLIQLV